MGCDIHPHLEIKVDGKWVFYSVMQHGRNYDFFGALAGVRNQGVEAFKEPKHLSVEDFLLSFKDEALSTEMREEVKRWGTDAHSHVVYSFDELNAFMKAHKDIDPSPASWRTIIHKLIKAGVADDARLIIWFDN